MQRPVTNTADYLIGRAQAELAFARSILERSRSDEDYFEEKAAAKLLAYHEHELALIEHYVELKLYHRELAESLERRKPCLRALWDEANAEWEEALRERSAEGATLNDPEL
jgi:hypothetical protein